MRFQLGAVGQIDHVRGDIVDGGLLVVERAGADGGDVLVGRTDRGRRAKIGRGIGQRRRMRSEELERPNSRSKIVGGFSAFSGSSPAFQPMRPTSPRLGALRHVVDRRAGMTCGFGLGRRARTAQLQRPCVPARAPASALRPAAAWQPAARRPRPAAPAQPIAGWLRRSDRRIADLDGSDRLRAAAAKRSSNEKRRTLRSRRGRGHHRRLFHDDAAVGDLNGLADRGRPCCTTAISTLPLLDGGIDAGAENIVVDRPAAADDQARDRGAAEQMVRDGFAGEISGSLGRKFETRTRTGTHTPCIQTSSTLFPFQAAFDLQAVRSHTNAN